MDIEVGICRYEGSIFRVPSPFLCAFLLYLAEGHSSMGPPLFSSNYFFYLSPLHVSTICFSLSASCKLCPDSTRSRRGYSKRR